MPKVATRTKRKPLGASAAPPGTTAYSIPELRPYRNTSDYEVAAQTPVDKPLTDKQRQFVKEWASGESITSASIRAGYENATQGYRMVRMPNILAAYEQEKLEYQQATKITKAKIIEQFQEAYDMAKLQADPFAMVSATRETGKLLGFYEPVKRKIEVNFTNQREMTAMSNEELQKLLDESSPAQLGHDLGALIEDVVQNDEQSEEEE